MNIHTIIANKIPALEVARFILAHLLAQGTPAITTYEHNGASLVRCAYRGPDGTSCAVGCLLTDDDMTRVREGQSSSEAVRYALASDEVNPIPALLSDAQSLHDGFYSIFDARAEAITRQSLHDHLVQLVEDGDISATSPLAVAMRELAC